MKANARMQCGLSLIEVLIAIVIATLLIGLAVPSFNTWVEKQRSLNIQSQLIHGLNFTRSTALSLQQTVTLCPGLSQCLPAWGDSLLIFTDINADGERQPNEPILKQTPLQYAEPYLKWKSFNSKPYIQFNSSGTVSTFNGSFYYCPDNKGQPFKLSLARTGRIRNRPPQCN